MNYRITKITPRGTSCESVMYEHTAQSLLTVALADPTALHVTYLRKIDGDWVEQWTVNRTGTP